MKWGGSRLAALSQQRHLPMNPPRPPVRKPPPKVPPFPSYFVWWTGRRTDSGLKWSQNSLRAISKQSFLVVVNFLHLFPTQQVLARQQAETGLVKSKRKSRQGQFSMHGSILYTYIHEVPLTSIVSWMHSTIRSGVYQKQEPSNRYVCPSGISESFFNYFSILQLSELKQETEYSQFSWSLVSCPDIGNEDISGISFFLSFLKVIDMSLNPPQNRLPHSVHGTCI